MTVTFAQLIARARQQLQGFTLQQEARAELADAMTESATSFVLDSATVTDVGRGLVEIDDELIIVKSVDSSTATASVLGGAAGRGAEGTTAAAHAAQAIVTASPAFPRARIKEAINETILGLYPKLVVFAATEITKSAVVYEYELPTEVADVWYVTAETIGPSQVWQPVVNWRFNPDADPTSFVSGKSIQLLDSVVPGQSMRVVYAKPPAVLGSDADDFATTTGYPERITDLVVYGVLKRLLPALDSARLGQQAVEGAERAQAVPVASAAKSVQLYAALYDQRLEEERDRMYAELPTYQSFQGS